MKRFLAFATLLFMLTLSIFSTPVGASQYNAGTENADVATLPQGLTLGVYNSLYTADKLKDSNGNTIGNFDGFNYTAMLRAYYMTDWCFLGGKYGFGLGIPVGYQDVKFGGFKSDNFHLGDMYIEPLIVKWSEPKFDAFFSLGAFAPTGQFDANDPTSIGKGYWTGMASLGGKYYFDEAKTWSIYSVARYEISSEQNDTKFKDGDMFTGEYGIAKTFRFDKNALAVGAVGYTQVNTSDKRFDGADINDSRSFVTAVGPAVDFYVDSIGLNIGAKAFFEMAAQNNTEGMKFMLTATKAF